MVTEHMPPRWVGAALLFTGALLFAYVVLYGSVLAARAVDRARGRGRHR